MRTALETLTLSLGLALACASGFGGGRDHYLRWVAFEVPVNDFVLLRWPERSMPLRVHLPAPRPGLFEDPVAILDSVRDGITDWADVAGPGIPRFAFVDDAGDADIPIVWADEPDGNWYIAHCAYDVNRMQRRFGVSRILVTARWNDSRVADIQDVYKTMLHEMGHALGLGGHSPDSNDIMYRWVRSPAEGLSERDRRTLQLLYERPIGAHVTGARRERAN